MRSSRLSLILAVSLFALSLAAYAQSPKPGLYESTTEMTWQQSPLPPGMTFPPGVNNPFGGGKHTSQYCLTQAQIDRFGTIPPQGRGCQVTNVVKSPTGMTAEIVCSGQMSGKGSAVTNWSLDGHSHSKVHFTGIMQAGPSPRPVEWTSESDSSFKGPDCGSVKPVTASAN